MLVPVGGGSGACGLITVRDALGLNTRIIAVGAERADADRALLANRNARWWESRPIRWPKASPRE